MENSSQNPEFHRSAGTLLLNPSNIQIKAIRSRNFKEIGQELLADARTLQLDIGRNDNPPIKCEEIKKVFHKICFRDSAVKNFAYTFQVTTGNSPDLYFSKTATVGGHSYEIHKQLSHFIQLHKEIKKAKKTIKLEEHFKYEQKNHQEL
jgi:hypothetical protein